MILLSTLLFFRPLLCYLYLCITDEGIVASCDVGNKSPASSVVLSKIAIVSGLLAFVANLLN